MAKSRMIGLKTIAFFIGLTTAVQAGEAPSASLQPYQQTALQAAIGHKGKEVSNSLQLTPYPMASILAAGRQNLAVNSASLAADKLGVCVDPLNQYQPDATHDKEIQQLPAPGSGGSIKTFRLVPVCRNSENRR